MRANGTATANSTKDLVKEISVLKAQLKKLSTSIEKDAGGALGEIQTKSKEAIDEVIETAQAFIDGYSDSARETTKALLNRSAELRDEATETLIETVKARPIATLATVIGIGFLAGYLCRRS